MNDFFQAINPYRFILVIKNPISLVLAIRSGKNRSPSMVAHLVLVQTLNQGIWATMVIQFAKIPNNS